MNARGVQKVLERLFQEHGAPAFLRSDNGPEFVQNALKAWLETQNVQTLYIEPGSPWQNGKSESMHGKLRDECVERELFDSELFDSELFDSELFDSELFDSELEARCLIENYRLQFNSHRPHSALNYQTPDEFTRLWNQNQTSLT